MPKRNVKKQEKFKKRREDRPCRLDWNMNTILITVFIYLCMLNTRVYTSKCKSMEAYGRSSHAVAYLSWNGKKLEKRTQLGTVYVCVPIDVTAG